MNDTIIRISLAGDVMTGRGIDQILPFPCDPQLQEPYVDDAREYVNLAVRRNGRFRYPVDFRYVWGEAIDLWNQASPDVSIVNLETSVSTNHEFWPGKFIHYRMNPRNIGCLSAAQIDCCSIANNHVLDFGQQGLLDTLQTLRNARIPFAGAGSNLASASRPAILDLPGGGRVLIIALGHTSSGIPLEWGAEENRPGIRLFTELSPLTINAIRDALELYRRQRDLVIASIHWGPNWSYEISGEERSFAHQLIDVAGIDVVFGHSSHHIKGLEVYRGKLILYGCGDLLTDYEGIRGNEQYRGDLGLLYMLNLDRTTGQLVTLQMFPTQMKQMRIQRPSTDDIDWIVDSMTRQSSKMGVTVRRVESNGRPCIEL